MISFVMVHPVFIKGVDKFREKLPALSGKKIIILPFYAIFMVALAFVIYVTFDSLPATFAASGNELFLSFCPLIGTIIIEGVGFSLVWQLWLWRDRLKAK